MSLKIVHYPHPALRLKCKPVQSIDKDISLAAGAMLELMYKNEGLGLASTQVALDYQMIVINFAGRVDRDEQEVVAINPVIVETKGVLKDREGCLSFPGLYQDIRRAKTVTVEYYTLKGEAKKEEASDLAARIWQHEIDHINGVLFIDKMGPLARMSSRKALEEFVEDFEKAKKKGELPQAMLMKL